MSTGTLQDEDKDCDCVTITVTVAIVALLLEQRYYYPYCSYIMYLECSGMFFCTSSTLDTATANNPGETLAVQILHLTTV